MLGLFTYFGRDGRRVCLDLVGDVLRGLLEVLGLPNLTLHLRRRRAFRCATFPISRVSMPVP